MRLTWGNIDDYRISRHNSIIHRYIKNRVSYTIKEECEWCGDTYICNKQSSAKHCSRVCMNASRKSSIYINHLNIYNIPNKPHKGWLKVKCDHCDEWFVPDKKRMIAVIQVLKGNVKGGVSLLCSDSCKQSSEHYHYQSNLKGYNCNNIPLYNTYKYQLEPYGVKCRRSLNDSNVLEVRCYYNECGEWFTPSRVSIRNKIQSLSGYKSGSHNLYCSDGCKKLCPSYRLSIDPFNISLGDRNTQKQLRKMVLERDNWTCQRCNRTDRLHRLHRLHCHHIDPVKNNPVESADVGNCITLCVDCHKEAHQKDGMKTGQLAHC